MVEKSKFSPQAIIKVIGVGGSGGNAINTMIESGLTGVEFIAANTDVQSLQSNLAPIKIQLGRELTKGLGAGANPDVGRDAAVEDKAIIQEVLAGAEMVFVTAGMGGGTGTGAAPIIAQVAREMGILTVGVVTKPFNFEGRRRKGNADAGIQGLRASVDTLITIPNQRLLSIAPPDMSMLDAFKLADEVLLNAVKGISDIINQPGRINVDFADVKTTMAEMGMAIMGIGKATGANRAQEAARAAINSPLLEDVDIEGATGVLINITGPANITLHEISEANTLIQEAVHEDANIIFGVMIDENMGDSISITVIATGFDNAKVAFSDENSREFISQPPARQNNNPQYHAQPVQQQYSPQSRPGQYSGYDNRPQNAQFNNQRGSENQNSVPSANHILTRNSQEVGQHSYRQNPPMPAHNDSQERDNARRNSNAMPSMSRNLNAERSNSNTIAVKNRNEAEELTAWTMEMSRQPENSRTTTPTKNPNSERAIMGASTLENQRTEEFSAEDAFLIAKELSEVALDDTDFETPAYLRRKEDDSSPTSRIPR